MDGIDGLIGQSANLENIEAHRVRNSFNLVVFIQFDARVYEAGISRVFPVSLSLLNLGSQLSEFLCVSLRLLSLMPFNFFLLCRARFFFVGFLLNCSIFSAEDHKLADLSEIPILIACKLLEAFFASFSINVEVEPLAGKDRLRELIAFRAITFGVGIETFLRGRS